MSLDHLVYGVPDLARGVEVLAETLGVRAAPGGSHPGFGTRNALLSIGPDTYLEIIGPDPEQPPTAGRWFDLDALVAPRLVTWAAKADNDIEARTVRARAAGFDPGPVVPMSRQRPDGSRLAWHLTLAPRLAAAGLVPFLIAWGESPHPGAAAPEGCTLAALYGEHPRPEEVRPTLAALGVTLELRTAPQPALVAELDTPRGHIVLR